MDDVTVDVSVPVYVTVTASGRYLKEAIQQAEQDLEWKLEGAGFESTYVSDDGALVQVAVDDDGQEYTEYRGPLHQMVEQQRDLKEFKVGG